MLKGAFLFLACLFITMFAVMVISAKFRGWW
jgi:hypothetical protein